MKSDFSFGTAKNSGLPGSVNKKIHLCLADWEIFLPCWTRQMFLLVCLVQKIDFSSLKDIPFTCRSVSGR